MTDDIKRILETLKAGGTIDSEDAVIYGQYVIRNIRSETIEECAVIIKKKAEAAARLQAMGAKFGNGEYADHWERLLKLEAEIRALSKTTET